MQSLVDIHCHILPGIDDGPDDMSGSVSMARAAVEAGIGTVAATPHLRADFPLVKVDEIRDRCVELQDELDRLGVRLNVVPAAEVSIGWALEASDEALRQASYGQRGTDVLVETPTVGGVMLPNAVGQVAVRGYRVTLAHPERLVDFQKDPGSLERIVERQVLLEVNSDAVLGNPRKSRSAKLAHELLGRGIVSVVASDGHRGADHRPIGRLGQARSALVDLVGVEAASVLTESAPGAVLAGEPLPAVPRQPAPPTRNLFRRRR